MDKHGNKGHLRQARWQRKDRDHIWLDRPDNPIT
jgi:hypothetical protein